MPSRDNRADSVISSVYLDLQSASKQARAFIAQVEEGADLTPKFDDDRRIVCVTTAADDGEVLMLGYMNRDALEKTMLTGEAHYWSRSRQKLWCIGATRSLVQWVEEMRIDDDQDAIWLRVRLSSPGASCHVGYPRASIDGCQSRHRAIRVTN